MRRPALALFFMACAAHADQPAVDPLAAVGQAATLAYGRCAVAYAKARAEANATATEIAEAALASCSTERSHVRDAARAGMGLTGLDEFLATIDKQVWRFSVQAVVEARMASDKPPPSKGKSDLPAK